MGSNAVQVSAALQQYLAQPSAAQRLLDFFQSWRRVRRVSPKTVARWIEGSQLPTGENLNVLVYFLAKSGFDSAEYSAIPERYRTCLAAIVYNVAAPKHIADKLGLTEVSNLWRAFRGRALLPYREKILADLSEGYLPTVADHEKVWFGADAGETTAAALPDDVPRGIILNVLADQMRAMLPLVRLVNGDSYSDAERQELRALAGRSTVFDLSNGLSSLCSREARKQERGTKRNG